MDGQKVIGIVGGGQLGRMLTLAALPLGFRVVVVDPGENCPAAQAGAQQIMDGLQDEGAIRELAHTADYITIEIEHLNSDILELIEQDGTPVNPKPQTIKLIQDKFKQKQFLQDKCFAVAPFRQVDNLEQAKDALEHLGGSMILKTRHNAYDGRGNAVINSLADLEEAIEKFGDTPLYAEKIMDFSKELAVMVAKDFEGNLQVYTVAETVHQRNICVEVFAPAQIPQEVQTKAGDIAKNAVEQLAGAGVFGVELFLLKDGSILINEIAPRVHNSGHYTMDACITSQFEQHIRAISGLPLGDTSMVVPAVSMINILGEHARPVQLAGLNGVLGNPMVRVHLYGKSPTKIDRKMGHINVLGETAEETRRTARQARKSLTI